MFDHTCQGQSSYASGVTASQRQAEILDVLEREGRLSVSEFSAVMNVSEMTVRRDLQSLEQRGVLARVHGGAVPARSRSYEPPFEARLIRNVETKRRIGEATAALLHDGETVVLDAGTTALAVAEALRGRQLRILATNLRVADVLADEPGIALMVSGGAIRPGERSLVGPLAERSFADLAFDTLVLAVGGIDLSIGVTDYRLEDASLKRAALASARRCVAIADSSKLGQVAFARTCPIGDLDVLVTDDGASPALVAELREAGVEVVVV
jgi:DeoR/GlpR family transcriptional regulator of sugar metabolism